MKVYMEWKGMSIYIIHPRNDNSPRNAGNLSRDGSITVKLPWIFPGAPLNLNGAPGNIQGNLTGIWKFNVKLVIELSNSFRSFAIATHAETQPQKPFWRPFVTHAKRYSNENFICKLLIGYVLVIQTKEFIVWVAELFLFADGNFHLHHLLAARN